MFKISLKKSLSSWSHRAAWGLFMSLTVITWTYVWQNIRKSIKGTKKATFCFIKEHEWMCFRVVGGKRLKINAPQTNSTLHDKHSGHTLNIFSDTTSDKCCAATLVLSSWVHYVISPVSVWTSACRKPGCAPRPLQWCLSFSFSALFST